jgi:hypothetical protein
MADIIRLGFRGREATLAQLQEEVGPGWAGIIERLTEALFPIGWNGVILQCKEKFGGLRFYTGETTEDMETLITAAESESYRTCETCGAVGKPRQGGWIKTLCDEHAQGREPHEDLI